MNLKRFQRDCLLGALGWFLMLIGDLCLSAIPASQGSTNAALCIWMLENAVWAALERKKARAQRQSGRVSRFPFSSADTQPPDSCRCAFSSSPGRTIPAGFRARAADARVVLHHQAIRAIRTARRFPFIIIP